MSSLILAIAGGSGAGKTTLSMGLWKLFSEQIVLVQLDDYFHPAEKVPQLHGLTNWDSPEALDFETVKKDLQTLKAGRPISRRTRSLIYNPDYPTKGKQLVTFEPRPIILFEGYLALHNAEVRSLFDSSLFLDVPTEVRTARRRHDASCDTAYISQILKPMHEQYVAPSKVHAQHIINVAQRSKEEVLSEALSYLSKDLPAFEQ